jgi:hypothetical protein
LIIVFFGLGSILFFLDSNKITIFYNLKIKLGLQKQSFLYEGRPLETTTPPELLNLYKLELENLDHEILSQTSTTYLSVDALHSRLSQIKVPREMLAPHMELFVKIDKLKNFRSSDDDLEKIVRDGFDRLKQQVAQI